MHANALAGLTRFDAAIAEIQQAIALDPTRSGPYWNFGALQLAAGSTEHAEDAFRRAVEVEPRSITAHLMLASYYWAAGRFADAERSLQRAVAIDPKHLGAHRALAVFYLGANRAADAEAHLKTIAETAPSIEADLALADLYVAMQRPGESVQILQRVARQPAGYGEARSVWRPSTRTAGRHAQANRNIDALARRRTCAAADEGGVSDPRSSARRSAPARAVGHRGGSASVAGHYAWLAVNSGCSSTKRSASSRPC
jgi:Tfp pilus assembly protein PilF